jgi:hypothetical protein
MGTIQRHLFFGKPLDMFRAASSIKRPLPVGWEFSLDDVFFDSMRIEVRKEKQGE